MSVDLTTMEKKVQIHTVHHTRKRPLAFQTKTKFPPFETAVIYIEPIYSPTQTITWIVQRVNSFDYACGGGYVLSPFGVVSKMVVDLVVFLQLAAVGLCLRTLHAQTATFNDTSATVLGRPPAAWRCT